MLKPCSVRLTYRRSLRASSPPPTSNAPAPSASSEAPPVGGSTPPAAAEAAAAAAATALGAATGLGAPALGAPALGAPAGIAVLTYCFLPPYWSLPPTPWALAPAVAIGLAVAAVVVLPPLACPATAWARAGAAAASTMASIAANNITFLKSMPPPYNAYRCPLGNRLLLAPYTLTLLLSACPASLPQTPCRRGDCTRPNFRQRNTSFKSLTVFSTIKCDRCEKVGLHTWP